MSRQRVARDGIKQAVAFGMSQDEILRTFSAELPEDEIMRILRGDPDSFNLEHTMDVVEHSLGDGVTEDKVKEYMLKRGVPEEDIDRAIREVRKTPKLKSIIDDDELGPTTQ